MPIPSRMLVTGLLAGLVVSCGEASGGGGSELLPIVHAGSLAPTIHDEAFLRAYRERTPGARRHHDPLAVLVLAPDLDWTVSWPEHPEGGYRKVTNERGLVEEHPTPLAVDGYRVLVLGDSHTEGVVSTDETFANVLEARLAQDPDWAGVDVLNAGVGTTGPHAYLGMLHRQLELRPDHVVATLFTGNDFWDDLHAEYLLAGERPPSPGPEYFEPLLEVRDRWSAAAWQGLNQIYRFRRYPQERERALEAVLESLTRMQALCDAEGIDLTVALLPTKFDTEDVNPRLAREAFGLLGLEREDAGDNARLAADLAARLAAQGVDVLDLLPALRAETEPCYWVRDHHLSLHGHRVVARVLEEHLRARVGAQRR